MSDNYFAKFKGPDGRYKRRTTGTADKAMAKKIMLEFERIALKAKRNDGIVANTLVKYAQEASELVTGQSIGIPSTKEFFESFLSGKEINKKEGTLRSYKTTVGKFLAHLGKVASQPIDKIKPDHVQAFVKARAADGTSPAQHCACHNSTPQPWLAADGVWSYFMVIPWPLKTQTTT